MSNAVGRLLLFALWTASFGSVPSHAIQLPGPEAPALLRVNSVRQIFFGPNISQIDRRQTLISRGGGVLTLLATGRVPQILAFKGLGTNDERAVLGQALGEASVGLQGDCTLGSSGLGHMEITWYGRRGRQNTFRVKFQEETPPPDEKCPVAVLFLVSRIEGFVSDAVSHLPQD